MKSVMYVKDLGIERFISTDVYKVSFSNGATASSGPGSPKYRGFTITQ
jgi:hypothetical protein